MNSLYVLEEYRPDDTMHSLPVRYAGRRGDSRNTILNPTFMSFMNDNERQKNVIREDDEYEPERAKSKKTGEAILMIPVRTTRTVDDQLSTTELSSQPEGSLAIPLERTINDEERMNSTNPDDLLSRSPRYQRTMSQDENYFSEHC